MAGWLVATALLLSAPASLLAQTVPRYAGPPTDVFLKRWLLLGPIPLKDKAPQPSDAQARNQHGTSLFAQGWPVRYLYAR